MLVGAAGGMLAAESAPRPAGRRGQIAALAPQKEGSLVAGSLFDWLSGRRLVGFEDLDPDLVRAWLAAEKAVTEGGGGGAGGSGGDSDDLLSDVEKSWPEEAKAIIRKERQATKDADKARKAAEKAARELQTFKEEAEGKDKTEVERAKLAEQKSKDREAKALADLRTTKVDFVIHAEAGRLKFRDADDAVRLVDRSKIDVEEDADEGTVDVDRGSVGRALEQLATAKPHLIRPENEGEPSGSKFGGPRNGDQKSTESQLRKKYPVLQGGQAAEGG